MRCCRAIVSTLLSGRAQRSGFGSAASAVRRGNRCPSEQRADAPARHTCDPRLHASSARALVVPRAGGLETPVGGSRSSRRWRREKAHLCPASQRALSSRFYKSSSPRAPRGPRQLSRRRAMTSSPAIYLAGSISPRRGLSPWPQPPPRPTGAGAHRVCRPGSAPALRSRGRPRPRDHRSRRTSRERARHRS